MSIGFHFILFIVIICFMSFWGTNWIAKLLGIPVYAVYDEKRKRGLATSKCQILRGFVCLICILVFLSQMYLTDPDPLHFHTWCLFTLPMVWELVVHTFLLIFRSDFYNEERGTEVMGEDFYNFPISHIDVLERYLGVSSMSLIGISFLFMMPTEWGIPVLPKLITLIVFLLINSVIFFPRTVEKYKGDLRTKQGIIEVDFWKIVSAFVPSILVVIVLFYPW